MRFALTALILTIFVGCSFSGAPSGSGDPDAGEDVQSDGSSNDGTDEAPLPARLGAWQQSENGTNSSLTDVGAMVVVLDSTPSSDSSLFVLAVASKPYVDVSAVSSPGLNWTELAAQCSARRQSGAVVWTAQAPPQASPSAVTIALDNDVQTAVAVVAQYDSRDAARVLATDNRDDGACAASNDFTNDDETYDLPLANTPRARVIGAVSLREHRHVLPENSSFVEVVEVHSGYGGADSGLVLLESTPQTSAPTSITGDFDGNGNGPDGTNLGNDWGAIALELR